MLFRSLLPPLMTTFDMCDSTLSCGQRDVTIVAPQALTLLNNDFVHQRAEALATRVIDARKSADQKAVEEVWIAILNRRPSSEELSVALEHIARQTARFASKHVVQIGAEPEHHQDLAPLLKSAVLALNAADGVTTDAGGLVELWQNQNEAAHEAVQPEPGRRPLLVKDTPHGFPAIRFNGSNAFLHLKGILLKQDQATVFAIVTDLGAGGHRELLSNWSGRDGNSGTSFFVGMTNENAVRLSDAISGVGEICNRQQPFLLTATNGQEGAGVFQQNRVVVEQPGPLPARRLDTAWVIGQQGNIDGEYWHGDVALLLVFDRQLARADQAKIQDYLIDKYRLPREIEPIFEPRSADQLALASLCLVLFNSNEFAYVD